MMQRNDFAANGLHFAAKRLVSATVTGMFILTQRGLTKSLSELAGQTSHFATALIRRIDYSKRPHIRTHDFGGQAD